VSKAPETKLEKKSRHFWRRLAKDTHTPDRGVLATSTVRQQILDLLVSVSYRTLFCDPRYSQLEPDDGAERKTFRIAGSGYGLLGALGRGYESNERRGKDVQRVACRPRWRRSSALHWTYRTRWRPRCRPSWLRASGARRTWCYAALASRSFRWSASAAGASGG
jgi:hypothetical protein